MKHIWSVLCQRSIIDRSSNTVSLIDVLEQLNINVSPEQVAKKSDEGIVIQINFDIVSFWTKDSNETKPANFEVVVEFNDPDGKKLRSFNKSVEVAENYQRIRTQIRVPNLQVFQAGTHSIRIRIKEGEQKRESQVVAELPLEIKFAFPAKEAKNSKLG